LRFTAGSEKNVILYVNGQPGASAAFTAEIVMGGHGHRPCINCSDVVLVSDADINVAVVIGDGLLRHPAEVDFRKDDKGKIAGATWTGKIVPYEFVEFGMPGINPKEGTSLVWKFVQFYEDGSKEEFTGPVGSRLPSP